MNNTKLKIDATSIKTTLKSYEDEYYKCLFEYIWNSFDANSTEVQIGFEKPKEGFGYASNVTITDNGTGWNFDDDATTNNFISSTKKQIKDHTLPKGQYGKGRYVFIWLSNKLYVFSKGKKLTLQHNTEIVKEDSDFTQGGTQLKFDGINQGFSDALLTSNLESNLVMEFGWFLLENSNYQILINGIKLDVDKYIKESKEYQLDSFPDDIKKDFNGNNLTAKIIIWKEKPSEYSKFYFLNESSVEILKQTTGLNKKGDDFWHSVYVTSNLFNSAADVIDNNDENPQNELALGDRIINRLKKKIMDFLKKELVKIRKPYLISLSDDMLEDLKDKNLIPNLSDFGIYDDESYDDLLKTIYTISPSLFTKKSDAEKKFICATFAGLLTTEDNVLIKVILEQLQELTDDEKEDLLGVLKRTSLSNIIKTTKEIDHRLEVLDKLKILLSEHKKETLEVKHLQKILDENFWLFGEQFRLFSSTEGSIKNVLIKYAKEILEIEDPELENSPNGEVDLFLTKTESIGEINQQNIIVEIKRASIKLGKKEYDQIEGYMERIIDESLCNGENQYWEFYLIGRDYDSHIKNKIDSTKTHGEKEKGLSYSIKDGHVKIYVRKWSDILEVEWGNKMKYLKEKLKIQAKQAKATPQEITADLTVGD